MEGWISIHRKIFAWEWYTDVVVKTLFFHCLLKANHVEKKWRGVTIKRGQFLTSLRSLSLETGLTIKQVRRALDCLEDTKELGKETTKINTLITVTYYDKYQKEGKETAQKGHAGGHSKGKGRATTNNDNNDKQDNNDNNIPEVSEFLNHAKDKCKKVGLHFIESTVIAKYESWKDNGWIDGNGNKINSWKLKLTNTLPYILKKSEAPRKFGDPIKIPR